MSSSPGPAAARGAVARLLFSGEGCPNSAMIIPRQLALPV